MSLFLSNKFVSMRATVNVLTMVMLFTCVTYSMADNKRGTAGSQDQRENAINARWAYNYMNEPTTFDVGAANFEFVPMIFRATTVNGINDQIDRILAVEENFGTEVSAMLGFNEPERAQQANMSVELGLNMWEIITERFEGTDIQLVSPAVSGGAGIRDWLEPFMDEVEARNNDADPTNDLRVDAIAIHNYSVSGNPVGQANNLLNTIDRLYEDYGRPIWITEFAAVDFSGATPVQEKIQFNEEFLDFLIPRLESRDHVARYGWWQFSIAGNAYSPLSSVNNGVFTPTDIGHFYERSLPTGGMYDFATGTRRSTDVHYLRGGRLTNTGADLGTALRAIDAIEGNNIFAGTADYGFEDAEDSFIRVRDGATLRKQGPSTVTLPGSLIFNEGELRVEFGTLQLAGATELTGQGTLLVGSNGTLATSGSDVAFNSQPITLNQGVLHVEDGSATLPGELILPNPSVIRTDGNLVITGETTGTGAILSTGAGSLFLNGNGSHTAGAQVTQGRLIVANTQASPTGPGDVLVGGNGTFGGFGRVNGDLRASGGTVAPGVAESSSGEAEALVFDEGVVVDALDFNFAGVQDDAPLTQTSTLAAGLEVVSGLDFARGLFPRNASNAGNEFNVAGFTTGVTWPAAAADNDYLTFTVAPVDGLALELQDVSFELRRNGVNAATRYRIFTSIDGFAAFDDGLNPLTFIRDEDDTAVATFTAAYQGNELVTGPLEVRLYGWDAGNEFGNTRVTNASIDASFVSDPNSVAFDPTGILELGGDYTQLGFATLEIDLGGIQPGEYDQLQVAGSVSLNGTLDVSMIDGFEPAAGQTFDIITADSVTGTFSNIIAPEDMDIQVVYSSSGVSLQVSAGLVGDFDGDNDVDIDDIDFYVGNIGSQAAGELALLDFNGDGQITIADVQTHIETHVQTSNGQTGTFFGDFNLDGTVNVLGDAFTLVGSLGNSVSSYASGDANLDGTVDVLGDAFIVVGNLGRTNLP